MVSTKQYQDSITEESMEIAIRKIVKLMNGRCFHLRVANRSPELVDLPDLIVVLPNLLAIAELKSQKRDITSGQQEVIDLLAGTNRVYSGIVRPEPNEGETSYEDFLEILKEAG